MNDWESSKVIYHETLRKGFFVWGRGVGRRDAAAYLASIHSSKVLGMWPMGGKKEENSFNVPRVECTLKDSANKFQIRAG